MRGAIELTNIHNVILVLENGSFVVINVEIIGSGKDCHDRRESSRFCFTVHSVSVVVHIMSTERCDIWK